MSDISSSIPPVVSPQLTEAPPPDPAPTFPPHGLSPVAIRLWSLFAFGCAGTMLGIGMCLTPSPDGFGKHAGLFGAPPCGFYTLTGYPCPTCGCTTAVAHLAHGHFLSSLLTQPFGFTVGMLAFITIVLCSIAIVTGKWIGPSSFHFAWHWQRYFFSAIGLLLIGWIYKIIIIRMNLHPV